MDTSVFPGQFSFNCPFSVITVNSVSKYCPNSLGSLHCVSRLHTTPFSISAIPNTMSGLLYSSFDFFWIPQTLFIREFVNHVMISISCANAIKTGCVLECSENLSIGTFLFTLIDKILPYISSFCNIL